LTTLKELLSMNQNPIADIVDTIISSQRISRIPFEELCGFYAALQWGAPLAVVIRASGLDRSTVTHLRNAGNYRSGQFRYPRVAREFATLGKTEFSTKYLTAPIKDRLRVAKAQVDAKAAEPRSTRINLNADAYAAKQTLKDPLGGPDQLVEIVADRGDRPGWTWRDLTPYSETAELRGDPRDHERRFATSKAALAFCKLRFTPTKAQIEDGSYELACNDEWFWRQQKLK
jgi:hypothetical protein